MTTFGISYRISNNGDGTCEITRAEDVSGDVVIPESINNLKVTSIGDFVFKGCNSLTSIEIPNSVVNIGDSAFEDCEELVSITMPDSVINIGDHMFSGCSSLLSIKIPESVTSIGDFAFEGCSSLTSITIPNGVTSIGEAVFDWCRSLASIKISDNVTSIGCDAFWGCHNLTSINIPNNVINIESSAFEGCSSLTSITIPDSMKSIGDRAFADCTSLASIVLPEGVSLGTDVFGANTKVSYRSSTDSGDSDEEIENITASYCVIDLSAGADASKYEVTYLNSEPEEGFNTDEYKTAKRVLKRIPAGSFIMGEDQTDESHRVTLTKPFYIGIFQLTQKQWNLIMGEREFVFSGEARPVDNVSYDMIRGSNLGSQWPLSNAVDSDSFLGKLREKTGITFDLPTEAQWEYACRASTTTAYSCGDSADISYMRYSSNSGHVTHEVGKKDTNQWGLYDMHGNVWERCLDWYGELSYGKNPVGAASGKTRLTRGGGYDSPGGDLKVTRRGNDTPDYFYKNNGFRLVLTLGEQESADGITDDTDESLGDDTVLEWSGYVTDPLAWSASDNNVLLGIEPIFSGSQYTEAGRLYSSDSISRLSDGIVDTSSSSFTNTYGIKNGTLTWILANAVDLCKLRINTHWCDGGRDGVSITSVEVKTSASDEWQILENSNFSYGLNNLSSGSNLEFVYANNRGSVFAEDVAAIRFNLGEQDNHGTGFTEFEAVCVPRGPFTCTQYNINSEVSNLSVAKSCVEDCSKWASAPVTKYYPTIAFLDGGDSTSTYNRVPFPGNVTTSDNKDNFVVVSTATIVIPTDGTWSFSCWSDDGFELTLTRGGTTYTSSYSSIRSYAHTVRNFDLTAGEYELKLIYFDYTEGATCMLFATQGAYSSFDATAFKLLGESTCPVRFVNDTLDNGYVIAFNANGGSGTMANQKLESGECTNLMENAFEWNGYAFQGWATSANGDVVYADGASVCDLGNIGAIVMLYAVWEKEEEPSNYEYKITDNGDGTCVLTGVSGEVSGKVVLPSEINGLKVTSISEDFEFDEEDEGRITELVIPDTVTEFCRHAFSSIGSWKTPVTITLPHTLEHIWSWFDEDQLEWCAFNTESVANIRFSNGSTSNDAGTYHLVVDGNRMLIHCEEPGKTNLIALAGNLGRDENHYKTPETIIVPDGVTSIAADVFDDMDRTKKISLPESLEELRGDIGLGWVYNLEEIEVRGTKSPYKVIGNSLVDTRTKTLIQVTKNTVIPNDGTVLKIASCSCINDLIKELVFPDAVEEIADYAAASTDGIEVFKIGKGVKSIGGGAFRSASADKIKCISISPENPYYEVVNGCVIRKADNVFVSTAISQMTYLVYDEEWEDYGWEYDVEVPYFCSGVMNTSLDEDDSVRTVVLPKDLTLEVDDWVDPIGVQGICIADCASLEEAKESATYENFDDEGYLDTDEELTISFTSKPQVAVRTVGAVTVQGYGRYTPGTTVTLTTTYVENDKQVVWYKVDRENSTSQKVATGNTYSFTMPSDNVFYSAEVSEGVAAPVITPADGTTCAALSCTVTISCATDGATVYYTTNGVTPRLKDENLYTGPFEITGEATIVAVASKNGVNSDYVEATITCAELTLAGVLDETKLVNVTTGGDAEWEAITDSSAKVGSSVAKSGIIGKNQTSWLEATVYDKGTLSFWWKVSCEPDGRVKYTYDHVAFSADGEVKARLDGEQSVWQKVSVTFDTYGIHTLRWAYITDNDDTAEGYQECAWVDGVSWTGEGTPVLPSVDDDAGADVTLDAEKGYVITPSEGAKEVKVTIPEGVDKAKVTVKVPPETQKVAPNGAAVKVVRGENDITDFLNIPTEVDGVIDLSAATVKEAVVKETLSVEDGAEITLSPEKPVLKTAKTKPGLTYQFYEGATLDALKASGEPKIGDGNPWIPEIKVKGGSSAFYTIEVTK